MLNYVSCRICSLVTFTQGIYKCLYLQIYSIEEQQSYFAGPFYLYFSHPLMIDIVSFKVRQRLCCEVADTNRWIEIIFILIDSVVYVLSSPMTMVWNNNNEI